MQGEHDDLVMGLAIAHAIRGQQSYLPEESGDGGAYAEEWIGDGGDADFWIGVVDVFISKKRLRRAV